MPSLISRAHSPFLRSAASLLAPSLILFGALVAVRHGLVRELEIDYAVAWQLGVGRGWVNDAAVALLPALVAQLLRAALGTRFFPAWAGLAVLIWGGSVANLLYFQYFGTRLEGWTVRQHLSDVWVVRREIGAMLLRPSLLLGLAVAAGASIVVAWRRPASALAPSARRASVWVALSALGVAIGLASTARWLEPPFRLGGSVLSEQVWFVASGWPFARERHDLEKVSTTRFIEDDRRRGLRAVSGEARASDRPAAASILAAYRDWQPEVEPAARSLSKVRERPAEPSMKGWPLLRERRVDRAATRRLRERMGLPPDRAPHIVVLFLESVRAFEVQHPEFGRELFAELWKVMDRRGLRFETAYSSAMSAGLTVRGQFSTLCSMLPNMGGGATYIAHPGVRVRCLAELARENGYQTLWLSGGNRHFHNKFVFESLHGTDDFYDESYFEQFSFVPPYPPCGYPDKPLLQRSVDVLVERAREGRPLFASILTISTHVPYSEVAEAPLPPRLEALLGQPGLESPQRLESYRAFLSRLRYLDQSLGLFFERLFESEIGAETVVLVLGDHGLNLRTVFDHRSYQKLELLSRVPMALVTRDMPAGAVASHPVHQIDVAPTLADLAGMEGMVSWLGRGLLEPPGSPWLFADGDQLHYRVGDRSCYTDVRTQALLCYELPEGVDPLYALDAPVLRPRPEIRDFVRDVGRAAREAITLNRLLPPGRHAGREDAPSATFTALRGRTDNP